jgi:hypothetical protein
MPDRSSHWAALLDPALTEAFYTGYSNNARRQSLIPVIYDVRKSNRATETHQGVGVLGSDGWNFEDSGRVQYDARNKGFPKTFTHVEYAKGIMVERKLVNDNQTQIAFDDADALGDSAFRKREKSAASVFNNAFTSTTNEDGSSTLGPDGLVLCSDAHVRSAEDSTTWDNKGTSALSPSSLSTTRTSMMAFEDDRGDIIDVMPDLLLVPPELEDTAIPLTGSALDPTSGNNAINPIPGRFQTIVWHYLTDPNNWFMIDSGRKRKSLLWYERIPLEFAREEDFETLVAKYRAYMRYSYGFTDPSWVYGHEVSG